MCQVFKVTLNFSSTGTQKYARKRSQHEFEERIDKSVLGTLCITWQSLIMPSCDPLDRFVYPIHKLMINFIIYAMKNKGAIGRLNCTIVVGIMS